MSAPFARPIQRSLGVVAAAVIAASTATAAAVGDGAVVEATTDTSTAGAGAGGSPVAVAEAALVDRIELDRADLGFLISDGEFLWASGADGAVVRVDPDDHTIDELTIFGGSIGDGSGPVDLFPAIDGDVIWWSALGQGAIIPVDRHSLDAGPVIEVSAPSGLVVPGPAGQLWIEQTERPAALHPVDRDTGAVGPPLVISEDDEMVGSTAAFGSIWAPLYDGGTVEQLTPQGDVVAETDVGLGPMLARAIGDALWVSNAIDGTVTRIDPQDLSTTVVDLSRAGPPIDAPAGVVATSDAVWTSASELDGHRLLVYRIDPDTAEVVGVRSLPGALRSELVRGMAGIGDRLFVLDGPHGQLLELDTDQFTRAIVSASTTVLLSQDVEEVGDAVHSVLSSDATADEMAAGIVDGDRLVEQIAAFKQFFADNLPGQAYAGEVLAAAVDGDQADVTFVVTVADEPIVDPIQGSLVRAEGRWLLASDSFCRLVAAGGIECPADLAAEPAG
jgi:streptogramin lyase